MSLPDESFDGTALRRIRTRLKRWYGPNARTLPWRETHDPYHIWISEIMLQQTTVAAVIPYYERFLKRFPTVKKLAAAREQTVLRLWEGLGYYSRARNIHRTAKIVAGEMDGNFPTTVAGLQALPGIGRYTAGAIASFAYDQRAPIVEANTQRLYCRLLGFSGDPTAKQGQNLLWSFAESVLPRKSPGDFNQALMELGATVCSPKQPSCETCPLAGDCRALADGQQHNIPRPKSRPKITELTEVSVAIQHDGRFLLRQCQDNERWAGLWDFIRFEVSDDTVGDLLLPKERSSSRSLFSSDSRVFDSLAESIQQRMGLTVRVTNGLTEFRHSVTRYRIRLLCFTAEFLEGSVHDSETVRWVKLAKLSEVPLSVTGRKFAERL